jgi:hypothetical protein
MPRQTLPKWVGSGVFITSDHMQEPKPTYGQKVMSLEKPQARARQVQKVKKAACTVKYKRILRLDLAPRHAA